MKVIVESKGKNMLGQESTIERMNARWDSHKVWKGRLVKDHQKKNQLSLVDFIAFLHFSVHGTAQTPSSFLS